MSKGKKKRRPKSNSARHHSVTSTVSFTFIPRGEFDNMRQFSSFEFATWKYEDYLKHVESGLTMLRTKGVSLLLSPIHLEDFIEFCESTAIDPDSSQSRAAFAGRLATEGEAFQWEGTASDFALYYETLGFVNSYSEDLIGKAVGSVDVLLETMTSLMFTDIGKGESGLFTFTTEGFVHYSVQPRVTGGRLILDPVKADVFTTVLTANMLEKGSLVLRSSTVKGNNPIQSTVMGWVLSEGTWLGLSEAELFDAYCTHTTSGEPVVPKPGVVYVATA